MTTERIVNLFWKLTSVVFGDGAGYNPDGYARILKGIGCAKDSPLFEPVMAHLKTRFAEDKGLLADCEGKSWENIEKYIRNKAREQAQNGCAWVAADQVYEWAEDYIRMPDKEYKIRHWLHKRKNNRVA